MQPVRSVGVEIEDEAAFEAMEMVVRREVGVIAAGIAASFDSGGKADAGEKEQGAVDGVEGDMGEGFLDAGEETVSGGMKAGAAEFAVDQFALGGDTEAMRAEGDVEVLGVSLAVIVKSHAGIK